MKLKLIDKKRFSVNLKRKKNWIWMTIENLMIENWFDDLKSDDQEFNNLNLMIINVINMLKDNFNHEIYVISKNEILFCVS